MSIQDDLRKLAMAGLGAASVASEKTQEALESLAKRGEETLAQGKVMNERLHREVQQAVKEHVTVVETKLDLSAVLTALEAFSAEERAAVREKLNALDSEPKANEQAE
ncbi:MAG TPA: hypothetical protein PLP25_09585 [Candidatus Limiplasma sp.]|nr:hypothetical protein [Candidatus Limiplasma sp.]HPS82094.1 hypothetical protein [Candidatus Limiplasma sp.]